MSANMNVEGVTPFCNLLHALGLSVFNFVQCIKTLNDWSHNAKELRDGTIIWPFNNKIITEMF